MLQQKYNKTVQVQVTIIPRQPGKEFSDIYMYEVELSKGVEKKNIKTKIALLRGKTAKIA